MKNKWSRITEHHIMNLLKEARKRYTKKDRIPEELVFSRYIRNDNDLV